MTPSFHVRVATGELPVLFCTLMTSPYAIRVGFEIDLNAMYCHVDGAWEFLLALSDQAFEMAVFMKEQEGV